MEFSVHQAKIQLAHLLDLVEKGERVVISRHGKAIAELSPMRDRLRKLGAEAHLPPFPQSWDGAEQPEPKAEGAPVNL